MYNIAVSMIRDPRLEPVPFMKPLLVELLLHRETGAKQADGRETGLLHFFRRRIGYVQQRYADCHLDRIRP